MLKEKLEEVAEIIMQALMDGDYEIEKTDDTFTTINVDGVGGVEIYCPDSIDPSTIRLVNGLLVGSKVEKRYSDNEVSRSFMRDTLIDARLDFQNSNLIRDKKALIKRLEKEHEELKELEG